MRERCGRCMQGRGRGGKGQEGGVRGVDGGGGERAEGGVAAQTPLALASTRKVGGGRVRVRVRVTVKVIVEVCTGVDAGGGLQSSLFECLTGRGWKVMGSVRRRR